MLPWRTDVERGKAARRRISCTFGATPQPVGDGLEIGDEHVEREVAHLAIGQAAAAAVVRGVQSDNGTDFLRCVRSTSAAPTGARYTPGTLGSVPTVHDNRTGLTWQQFASADAGAVQYTQPEATAACVALGSGWRVPTYKELVTLVDYAQTGATGPMNNAAFTGTPSGVFWTSTPLAYTPPYQVWQVYFDNGNTGYNTTNVPCYVRCVQ